MDAALNWFRRAARPPAGPRLGLLLDVALVLLVAVGVAFRFSWTNWSQDTDLHPDEYGLAGTLTQLRLPDSLGDYFNTRLSPLSPYQKYDFDGNPTLGGPDNRMRWGQWPITIFRAAGEWTGNTGFGEIRLLGRRISALADSLALLVTYLIGRRLYGHRAGLIAAALSALAVMQIQQSHFMTADNLAVLFTVLAMYCAVRAAQVIAPASAPEPDASEPANDAAWLWYALFGVAFGMALASRINLLPLFGEILLAALVQFYRQSRRAEPAGGGAASLPDLASLVAFAVPRVALAGLFGLLTFRVTQPMSFRAERGDTTFLTWQFNPEWVASMEVAQAESSGIGGGPPGEQWTDRPALVFPFVNMVLWGMGLPLGLLAWAGLGWAAWRTVREGEEWQTHLLPLSWAGGYFLFMGTRWVKSIRYFLPIYPFMALFAAWAIVELWRIGRVRQAAAGTQRRLIAPTILAGALGALVLFGALAWAWGFTAIYRTDNTRVQASRWIYQNVPAPFNLDLVQPDGSVYVEPLPAALGTELTADAPLVIPFEPRVWGEAAAFRVGFARNVFDLSAPGVIHVVLAADAEGSAPLGETYLRIHPDPAGDARGVSAGAPLTSGPLEAGRTYFLRLTAPEGGPIAVAGSVLSNESWDEGLPLRVDRRDGFGGLYRGLTMEVRWQDDENKRQMFLDTLDQVDYIFVPSQRALWSASRLPATYPMTMAYYRALFEGRLGFDLAAQFHSPIRLGPLQISDVAGTLAWGGPPPVPPPRDYPFNFNPLAAEEAFSVYDHAPVWIFRKRADFDLEQARQVLEAVDLTQVVIMGPVPTTRAPGLLRLPPDRLAAQRAGGTWSEMFDAEGALNRFQPLGVLAWWLLIVVLGWLAFPLAFAALGGLPDKGFALSKSLALVCVAWPAWLLGSLQVLPFTRPTLALAVLALAVVSGILFRAQREQIVDHVRANRRGIVLVEGLALVLFLAFLLVRLGNPDLWHPHFGGEKPMVFSYFNAVLKSVSFPPYNPWLAGHFLNYYYYGFVLVGVPVKLLGIVPAFAYNLILPTLFALAGVNAFSLASNLVAHAGSKPQDSSLETQAAPSNPQLPITNHHSLADPLALPPPRPSPILAGLAAALLLVVLGNLGQWRTLVLGFQTAADRAALSQSVFGDSRTTATLQGAWRVATGQSNIPIGLGNWYWDATRIIPALNGEGSEITEFPLFTFLYADLHAHMIDLPFTLLALGWAAAYLFRARARRGGWAVWLTGGLILGLPRLTNTWDYPTFLALGLLAVLAGELLRAGGPSRAYLISAGWRAALLAGLAIVLYYPFDLWFAPAYSELTRWEGAHTPLAGYLYIHGLFLFILAAFFARETLRWLAETPATVLKRPDRWLPLWLAGLGLLAAGVVVLWAAGVVAGALALPLMAWAGLLLLRRGEAMPLGKRAVLFLCGTALAITLFVELFALENDRMNTIFKFYIQVWALFSVAAGAALAWVWASLPEWGPRWRAAWQVALAGLVTISAAYTVTATSAKIRDRFPSYAAGPGCEPLPGVPMPYPGGRSLPPAEQPRTLDGMAYLSWSAYCERDRFLPLVYDYEAIRWMQDNVPGSPVIAEAQSFDLYRMSSRYTWNTGLPDVVGWDWHTRQHNAAIPTGFVTQRGNEIIEFYNTPDPGAAQAFLDRYDVRYIIVGPMERAYYPPEGLAKFDAMAAAGELLVAYQNPGVTIYSRHEE